MTHLDYLHPLAKMQKGKQKCDVGFFCLNDGSTFKQLPASFLRAGISYIRVLKCEWGIQTGWPIAKGVKSETGLFNTGRYSRGWDGEKLTVGNIGRNCTQVE